MIQSLLDQPSLVLDSRKLVTEYKVSQFGKESTSREKRNLKRVLLMGVLMAVQGVLFTAYRVYYYIEYEVDVMPVAYSDERFEPSRVFIDPAVVEPIVSALVQLSRAQGGRIDADQIEQKRVLVGQRR